MQELFIFEWDERKNNINKRKHGISFEIAKYVFADINRIELYDLEHSINEDRYITIGIIDNVYVVVYTIRNTVYRIISARKATKEETEFYEENCGS